MFGFRAEEVLGLKGTQTINPPIGSYGIDQNRMLSETFSHPEKHVYNENENIRKDGSRLMVAWHNKAVYDDDGNVLYVQCIGRDITEQKKLEQKHAEGEKRYRQLFENMPVALWEEDFSKVKTELVHLER